MGIESGGYFQQGRQQSIVLASLMMVPAKILNGARPINVRQQPFVTKAHAPEQFRGGDV